MHASHLFVPPPYARVVEMTLAARCFRALKVHLDGCAHLNATSPASVRFDFRQHGWRFWGEAEPSRRVSRLFALCLHAEVGEGNAARKDVICVRARLPAAPFTTVLGRKLYDVRERVRVYRRETFISSRAAFPLQGYPPVVL